MKKLNISLNMSHSFLCVLLVFCGSIIDIMAQTNSLRFYNARNGSSLELKKDSTFVLYRDIDKGYEDYPPTDLGMPQMRCSIGSNGKWKYISKDLIELSSEETDYGWHYEMVKKTDASIPNGKIFISIKFPKFSNAYSLLVAEGKDNSFYSNSRKRTILVDKTQLSLSVYMCNDFFLDTMSGYFKYRYKHKIFDNIDFTHVDYNSLELVFADFDDEFFEHEEVNHELISVIDDERIYWRGEQWSKSQNYISGVYINADNEALGISPTGKYALRQKESSTCQAVIISMGTASFYGRNLIRLKSNNLRGTTKSSNYYNLRCNKEGSPDSVYINITTSQMQKADFIWELDVDSDSYYSETGKFSFPKRVFYKIDLFEDIMIRCYLKQKNYQSDYSKARVYHDVFLYTATQIDLAENNTFNLQLNDLGFNAEIIDNELVYIKDNRTIYWRGKDWTLKEK